MHTCVHVHMHTHVCTHTGHVKHECAETRGQPQALTFRCCSLLSPTHVCIHLFLLSRRRGLCWTGTCQLGQNERPVSPGVLLSPSLQDWGSKHVPTCSAFWFRFGGAKLGPLCSQGRLSAPLSHLTSSLLTTDRIFHLSYSHWYVCPLLCWSPFGCVFSATPSSTVFFFNLSDFCLLVDILFPCSPLVLFQTYLIAFRSLCDCILEAVTWPPLLASLCHLLCVTSTILLRTSWEFWDI